MLIQIVTPAFRSAKSAAANVAGKFDYSDANDVDAQAVAELQVLSSTAACMHLLDLSPPI